MRFLLPCLCLLAAAPAFALPVYSWQRLGLGQATALNSQGKVVVLNSSDSSVYANGSLAPLPNLPDSRSMPYAINTHGQIVGQAAALLPGAIERAFSTDGITISDLGSLQPNGQAFAFGINDNGWAVGYSQIAADGSYEAFLHNGTSMSSLGNLGLPGSVAYGINNNGWVTGFSYVAPLVSHAFLYDGVTMRDLGTLGGAYAAGRAINSNGVIAGISALADGTLRPMSYTAANGMVSLGTLGGAIGEARGINDFGWIVGYSQGTDGAARAFLHDGSTIRDMNLFTFTAPLPASLYVATGINNAGQIIANGRDDYAYLLTPVTSDVPEPATWLLLSAGLAACGLRLRRPPTSTRPQSSNTRAPGHAARPDQP